MRLLSSSWRIRTLHACIATGLLAPGASRIVGSCLVVRTGSSLRLERTAEPDSVQSEWDLENMRAPDYAGFMANMAREVLDGRKSGPQRCLILGHGGGTMAADLLTRGDAWRLHVTAVEADADVACAAQRHFHPHMFAHSEASVEARLRLVEADAIDVVTRAATCSRDEASGGASTPGAEGALGSGNFDVVIEDFAYEQPGRLGAAFWHDVRTLTAHGGHVLVNTLYEGRPQLDHLASELRAGGWSDVRQFVDRGLQVEACEVRRSADPSTWCVRDNMIFAAVNQQGKRRSNTRGG